MTDGHPPVSCKTGTIARINLAIMQANSGNNHYQQTREPSAGDAATAVRGKQKGEEGGGGKAGEGAGVCIQLMASARRALNGRQRSLFNVQC